MQSSSPGDCERGPKDAALAFTESQPEVEDGEDDDDYDGRLDVEVYEEEVDDLTTDSGFDIPSYPASISMSTRLGPIYHASVHSIQH